MHKTQTPNRTLLAALFIATLGCNERQAEPNYDELIEDTCRATCPVTTECDPNSLYDTTDECIEMCIAGESWENLTQCSSRRIEYSNCVATLSCEQYQAYLTSLSESGPTEDYPCFDLLNALEVCDPNQPFEEPE